MMYKVHFICVHYTHYYNFLFQELKRECPEFKFQVTYLQDTLKNYPWKNKDISEYDIRYERKSLISYYWLLQLISRDTKVFFIAGWDSFSKILFIFLTKIFGKKIIILTDIPSQIPRNGIKQKIRRIVLNYLVFKPMHQLWITGKNGEKIAKEIYSLTKKKVENFPFVVDLNRFSPKPQHIKNKVVKIFSSGRLDINHKGYDIALAALSKLKEAVNFEYLIAGTGPDKEKIDKLIYNYGLQNYVKYLGWIEINDLINTYQDSDIFLHASRFDPYPNAVLEAMACGLVVVASNTAGSANDRIVDSKNGFIFKSGNSDHLFVKIIEAIQSKSFEDIQKNARKTALEWPVNYNISLIKKCLKLT